MTNAERVKVGLQPLANNSKLDAAALAKCNDMVAKNYWSHNSPDGNTPWHFFTEATYIYAKAGENLYYGPIYSSSASDIVRAWMDSPSHKAHIISADYTQVGFGRCIGSNYNNMIGKAAIVVQHLARPYVY